MSEAAPVQVNGTNGHTDNTNHTSIATDGVVALVAYDSNPPVSTHASIDDPSPAELSKIETTAAARSHSLAPHPSSSMSDPHIPLKITYKDLSWTVQVPNLDPETKKANPTIAKRVLDNVSGTMRPGKLTAVMGSSGAGKTTLLNVIAGYGKGGATTGSILVNGTDIGTSFMRQLSAFVHQQDIILPTMTVREAVRMAAFLRLPKTMSSSDKDHRVEEVLRWLNLVKVASNQIGSPEKKGISGGERRRVSVAMEMVRNPGILFLDEPTSGLDSFTAYAVAHLLQNVAHQHNRTIVATIHQPSSQIFHLFDDLILLNHGRIIYHGPACEAMKYFDFNLGYHIPPYTNPSDFIFMHILNGGNNKDVISAAHLLRPSPQPSPDIIDIEGGKNKGNRIEGDESKVSEATEMVKRQQHTALSPSSASFKEDEEKREKRIIDKWNEPNKKTNEYTTHYNTMLADVDSNQAGARLPNKDDLLSAAASWSTQFMFLCTRAMNDVIRNPYKLRARMGQSLFMGVFCGLCYLNVGLGQDSIQNRRGLLFFMSAGGIMNATMGTLTIFASEKEVFMREYPSKMYSLSAFFISKFAMELPLRIIFPLLMALIVYWMAGLQNTAENFFIFAGTLISVDVVGTSLGMLFATIFATLPIALAATPMLILPLMLFSGFFLNANSIPVYFDWMSYLSPIKYAFISLVQNEFKGLEFYCEDGSPCMFKSGNEVIKAMNFDSQPSLQESEGILILLAGGILILSFFALWRTSKKL